MNTTRIIKVFLASSEELAEERIRFGDFIRQLDNTYESRGYRIKLYKWEDLPSGYNGRPKQDEYNDKVRESDMFVGLFHTKAGEYTLEEYDVAKKTQMENGKPTIYVFCRELADGEHEEPELTEFKERLLKDIRHYWDNYASSEALQLRFILQLLKVENSQWSDLKVENGTVRLGEMEIARMDNLRFASDNKEYRRMAQRLEELPALIEKARMRVDKYPDEEDFKDEHQKLLNERNQLQEEFDQQQKYLLDTAVRIVQQQGEELSESHKRAVEAFERGDVNTANMILDEAEHNGDTVYEEYKRNEALQLQRQKNVHQTIDDLLLQTTTVMANAEIPVADRIKKVSELYRKADQRAADSHYNEEKYDRLLSDYGQFLYEYAMYKDALEVYKREVKLSAKVNGTNHLSTATSYSGIGLVYSHMDYYNKALEYHFKALAIIEKVLGYEHLSTAASYNNIGLEYNYMGDYDKALEYHFKALVIKEKVLGTKHPDTAISYNNIGGVYFNRNEYDKAMEYYFNALLINTKYLGTEHPQTAAIFICFGSLLYKKGNYPEALEPFARAFRIFKAKFGDDHTDTKNAQGWINKTIKAMQGWPE